MDALELLLTRSSQPRLQSPAPSGEELENIMQAALRVPDHAGLTPWRFIVCEGEGLVRLGQLFAQAAKQMQKEPAEIQRAAQLPKRAPMVIIAIACYRQQAKVPRIEQIESAACAVQAMQMAAVAQGFAGIWRTGSYAQDPYIKQTLELSAEDEIVGFLYLGTALTKPLPKKSKDSQLYFSFWR